MKAYELLNDEGKWTQGAIARNANGEAVLFDSTDAIAWCVIGAINTCYPTISEQIWAKLVLESRTGCSNLAKWNDMTGRSFKEVIALLIYANV